MFAFTVRDFLEKFEKLGLLLLGQMRPNQDDFGQEFNSIHANVFMVDKGFSLAEIHDIFGDLRVFA
jgi:hypothetical protein